MLNNWIDIAVGVLLLLALFQGFRKGLIIELASLLALILGVFGAIKFADVTAMYLTQHVDMPEDYTPLIAFALTFVIIVIAVHFVAVFISKLVKMVALNFINRLGGAVFSLLKSAIIISFFLFFVESVDQKTHLISEQTKDQSFFYYPMAGVAFYLIPKITDSEYFKVLEQEFNDLKEGFPDFDLYDTTN